MRPRSSGRVERWSHRACLGFFLLMWGLVLLRQFPALSTVGGANWPEAVLLVAVLVVTVSSLAQQISLQSALMGAGMIGMIGSVAHWASYVSGVPFGPLHFPHAYGTTPFQEWFFVPACIWVAMLLNARGLARLILKPLAKHRHHGLHLLGLSTLLVVAMAMVLEPYASTGHRYWFWGDTRLPVTWQNVPLSCLFAWGVVSIIASVAATPVLINKHPRPAAPSGDAALIWAMMSGLFAVGTAVNGLWPATIVGGLNCAIAAGSGLMAMRWASDAPSA